MAEGQSPRALSGLLTCGCCGTRYGIVVNDRYGCLGHFRKGTCENGRTIRRDDIERRVLAGLSDKLVSPDAVALAVRAYAEETRSAGCGPNRRSRRRAGHVYSARAFQTSICSSMEAHLDNATATSALRAR